VHPPEAMRTTSRGSNWTRWAVTIVILAALSVYYVFETTAGTFSQRSNVIYYYDLLARGFRDGHLYLPVEPDPALYAHGDPFDIANWQLWLWDASLYDRHYYLYWGPVPALLLLVFKWVTGFGHAVADQWLTLALMIGRLVAGGLLIHRFGSHPRTRQPAWIIGLGILVFGLANPTPFMMGRSDIWEASAAGGQCFAFLGLLACYEGFVSPSRRLLCFALAGLSWALALGSRVTVLVPIPIIIAITVGILWVHSNRRVLPALRNLLAFGIPVAAAVALYGIYNYQRFGDSAQFGVKYQATLQPFWTSPRFIVPNLFSYAFAAPAWTCSFPFVVAPRPRTLSPMLDWPSDYEIFEPVTGMFVGSPVCVLLLVWLVLLCVRLLMATPPRQPALRLPPHELWLVLASLALMTSMVPALGLWEAAMRYLEDPIGGACLAAILAGFWLLRWTASMPIRAWRWSGRFVVAGLGLYTVVLGVLLAFRPYTDMFARSNPALYAKLQQSLSLCSRR
jgi:hypothetical protein